MTSGYWFTGVIMYLNLLNIALFFCSKNHSYKKALSHRNI